MKGKKEKLNIRLMPSEKKRLVARAEKDDMTVSDYVRKILFGKGKYQVEKVDKIVYPLIKIQEIANYISEKYSSGNDSKLERMLEEVWDYMND